MVLAKEAAMTVLREIPTEQLLQMKDNCEFRAVEFKDFEKALKSVVASSSKAGIAAFEQWRKEKG